MKGKIKQICVLVDDVQKAMKEYWEKFGIGHGISDILHRTRCMIYMCVAKQ